MEVVTKPFDIVALMTKVKQMVERETPVPRR
jgi:hypothetical protein